jgi:hypothetical protein
LKVEMVRTLMSLAELRLSSASAGEAASANNANNSLRNGFLHVRTVGRYHRLETAPRSQGRERAGALVDILASPETRRR